MKLTSPLKWHGGKHDLSSWIVSLMPPRCLNPNKPDEDDPGYLHYVEPYAGGLSVLLANDPDGISEVVNDLNGHLVAFWRALQCPDLFEKLRRRLEVTPFSSVEYEKAVDTLADEDIQSDLDRAWAFFVCCRQSLAGRMDGFTGITKTRTRRGINNEVSAWLSCIDGLPAVHERLKRVLIVGPSPALDVIRKHDGPRTLFYIDSPYLHETRVTTTEYGEYEMTEENHRNLLHVLGGIKGRFLLSGYESALYNSFARRNSWTRHEKQINNHASGAKKKRIMTEVVWCGGGAS